MSNARHPNVSEPLTYTNAVLAQKLEISTRHLFTLAQTGRIGPEAIRLGNSVRWIRSDVEAWLSAGAPSRKEWESMKAIKPSD